jgi:alkylation response protein AidB-like acyl-CoA dehydrogenase
MKFRIAACLDSSASSLILSVVRDIVAREVAPRAAAIDASAEFPWDVVKVFGQNGLFGMAVPEQYGGSGLSLLQQCLVYEEVARACLTSSVTLADQKLGSAPLVEAGTETLKQRLLPPIASGDLLIAFALTEPDAGSDVSALKTTAYRRGHEYVLNGGKRFITNGNVAHLYSVFASTAPAEGRRGISCFLVPANTRGLSTGPSEQKMGIRGSPTSEVIFDACAVPAENLIGNEGDGFGLALRALEPARIVVAFQAVGLATGAMDYAGAYVAQREQFGRRVIDFQAIEFLLADMSTQIDAARYLARAAAMACELRQSEAVRLAAEAKMFASDVAMHVTTDAVQLLGGYGYMREFPVERMMRDAKVLQIFDGTNQIQRVIVGRELRRKWQPV